jgi:hypothetical protein
MSISLADFIERPTKQNFCYVEDEIMGLVVRDDETDKRKVVMELEIEYRTPKEVQEILGRGVNYTRKAIKKGGVKGLVADSDKSKVAMCSEVLVGWRMTGKALRLLEFPGRVPDPAAEIDFTPENVQIMAEKTLLSGVVNEAVTTYSYWFPDGVEEEAENEVAADDRMEDSEKNSESGSSGSSSQ